MYLRILHVTSGLVAGGKERQIIEVLKHLDKEKFKIGIITFNRQNHYTDDARANSIYFRELRKKPTRLEPFLSIWKCFRDFKPDIVHTWDSISSFYCLIPCKIYGIPIIDGSIRDAGVDTGLFYHFKRVLLKKADLVISNSRAGLTAYKIQGIVLYNVINKERFKELKITNEFNLVMTANFSDYKDHQTFLEASIILLQNNVVDNVYLLGGGVHKNRYITWLNDEYPELKRFFHFTGSVRNVEDFLAICKIGVLCSTAKYSEGLSNSVLEYMAAGLVPIVTNIGGSSEIILDGINGYLINPGDSFRIIEIVRSLKYDEDLYNRISQEASLTTEIKFSLKNNLELLANLYDGLSLRKGHRLTKTNFLKETD